MEYITNEQYSDNVQARCSKDFHLNNVHVRLLALMLQEFCQKADGLDHLKKALFYNKKSTILEESNRMFEMTDGDEYGTLGTYILGGYTGREDDEQHDIVLNEQEQQILHAIIGVATEAGELVESFILSLGALQKGECSREEMFDRVNLREEFGDVLWYVSLGLHAIGSNLGECMTVNDKKLEARYGPVFSAERANERDLDAERKELEG